MRKIAANYIFLPGFPVVKNGYVVLEGKRIEEVVDTGGVIREIPGLEFYGGMLVAGYLAGMRSADKQGMKILPFLEEQYQKQYGECSGLALVKGADLRGMVFLKDTVIERLI